MPDLTAMLQQEIADIEFSLKWAKQRLANGDTNGALSSLKAIKHTDFLNISLRRDSMPQSLVLSEQQMNEDLTDKMQRVKHFSTLAEQALNKQQYKQAETCLQAVANSCYMPSKAKRQLLREQLDKQPPREFQAPTCNASKKTAAQPIAPNYPQEKLELVQVESAMKKVKQCFDFCVDYSRTGNEQGCTDALRALNHDLTHILNPSLVN